MPNLTRPAYTICVCPDSHLLRARLNALFAAHPCAEGVWQRHVFWGDDGLVPQFWEHLTLQGLFTTPKALVVRNAQTLPAEVLGKQLSPALLALTPKKNGALPSPLVWPVICLELAFERGTPKVPAHIQKLTFWQEASARGWLETTPPLAGKSLSAFIRAEASRHGLALQTDESTLLENTLPPDAALISSELAKLALMADPKGRLPQNAVSLVGQVREELGIFELVRIIQQNRDAPAAWRRILEDRLSGENLIFAFVAIILREARVLWQCLAGSPPSLPPQIAMQKKITAQTLGFAGLAKLWELALLTDKGIKSGERSPEQAFEMLAAELFLLFGGRRSR